MGRARSRQRRLPIGSRRVRWATVAVTLLDALILAFTVLMAATGWRRGFLVGVLGLAGFVGGALLGTRLAGGAGRRRLAVALRAAVRPDGRAAGGRR